MPMSGRLLRPIASGVGFPIAEARDGSNNVIAATDYTDANGQAWRAHIFNASGTLTFSRGGLVEYLIVAGGGSGAGTSGSGAGGGGAGGLLTNLGGTMLQVPVGANTIVVGAGGAGRQNNNGLKGNNSSALGFVAEGGGFGTHIGDAGGSGGSGGGSGQGGVTSSSPGGAGVAEQGNSGGASGGGVNRAGGGGGASQAGSSGPSGNGGNGRALAITGVSVTYAGGGGGSDGAGAGAGGAGGGGAGVASGNGNSGTPNTGGGGGGGSQGSSRVGGSGGSGIVVVRYRWSPFQPSQPWDADALSYFAAVDAADGVALEYGVRDAINTFVVGCKADGIWSAIKASCILMGARTLSGALTPLVGAAPTNNGPFVSGDYNRKTGLVGNGTSKFIDTNRGESADGLNDNHYAVYASSIQSGIVFAGSIGGGGTASTSLTASAHRNRSTTPTFATPSVGFSGMSRSSSLSYEFRTGNATSTASVASGSAVGGNVRILEAGGNFGTHRLAFYSIGSSLSLPALDSRVTALYTAIGAAIP